MMRGYKREAGEGRIEKGEMKMEEEERKGRTDRVMLIGEQKVKKVVMRDGMRQQET